MKKMFNSSKAYDLCSLITKQWCGNLIFILKIETLQLGFESSRVKRWKCVNEKASYWIQQTHKRQVIIVSLFVLGHTYMK